MQEGEQLEEEACLCLQYLACQFPVIVSVLFGIQYVVMQVLVYLTSESTSDKMYSKKTDL